MGAGQGKGTAAFVDPLSQGGKQGKKESKKNKYGKEKREIFHDQNLGRKATTNRVSQVTCPDDP